MIRKDDSASCGTMMVLWLVNGPIADDGSYLFVKAPCMRKANSRADLVFPPLHLDSTLSFPSRIEPDLPDYPDPVRQRRWNVVWQASGLTFDSE
ncbi:hypothetical protein AVEN_44119-1 [Araneus ventricosus]|uniref:Uncharacterized protein n=1 Tax=Araneus ventricosus TaxID=182803 RepID=A0A4Y2DAW6_ARAVE|nr:hypothetical protein AVEN_44119-1 [Araneus ventricosus]